MTHAQRIAEQLRMAERDPSMPEALREQCRERREELEDEDADV